MTTEIEKAVKNQATYHMSIARREGSLFIGGTKKGLVHMWYFPETRSYRLEDTSADAVTDAAHNGTALPTLAEGRRAVVLPVLAGLYKVVEE